MTPAIQLEIIIEADYPMQHDLTAAMTDLVPGQHITGKRAGSGGKRFMLTARVENKSPDPLLRKIGAVLSKLADRYPGARDIDLLVRNVALSEQDLNTRRNHTPFSPVEGLRISTWTDETDAAPTAGVIFLEPSRAFGTGMHPTTRLCLHFMKQVADKNPGSTLHSCSVLDIGCGSGILTLGALRLLEAERVLGIEIDPKAVQAARRNLHINHLAHSARIIETSWQEISGKYDLVLANLVPSVLFKCASYFTELLEHNGLLITSGFPASMKEKVAELLEQESLYLLDDASLDGWGALLITK